MGTVYWLIDRDTREAYELGKGSWSALTPKGDNEVSTGYGLDARVSSALDDNGFAAGDYRVNVGRGLHTFLTGRRSVAMADDCSDGEGDAGFTIIASRYGERDLPEVHEPVGQDPWHGSTTCRLGIERDACRPNRSGALLAMRPVERSSERVRYVGSLSAEPDALYTVCDLALPEGFGDDWILQSFTVDGKEQLEVQASGTRDAPLWIFKGALERFGIPQFYAPIKREVTMSFAKPDESEDWPPFAGVKMLVERRAASAIEVCAKPKKKWATSPLAPPPVWGGREVKPRANREQPYGQGLHTVSDRAVVDGREVSVSDVLAAPAPPSLTRGEKKL